MESRERDRTSRIVPIFFLLFSILASRQTEAQLYSTVENGGKTTYTFYPENSSPVVVQSSQQQQPRALSPLPAPSHPVTSSQNEMDVDLDSITSLFKSPTVLRPVTPSHLSLQLVEASKSRTMSHRSGSEFAQATSAGPMIISSSILYPNSAARAHPTPTHSSPSLGSVVAPFHSSSGGGSGYSSHPHQHQHQVDSLMYPPQPQVQQASPQPTPSIGTSLRTLYESTLAHSHNQQLLGQQQIQQQSAHHQQLAHPQQLQSHFGQGQGQVMSQGHALGQDVSGMGSEVHPIFLGASSLAAMMNSATQSLQQQYPTPLNVMFSAPATPVVASEPSMDSTSPERGPWTAASSIRAMIRPRSGWKTRSSGWKPGSGLASSSSSYSYDVGSPVHHLPTVIHSDDSHSDGGGSYTSVSHSHSSSDPFGGSSYGGGWDSSSSKGWAAAQPLIKYVKDSLPSFGWLAPYSKGPESHLKIFSTVGKTLDATLGGAWAARRAVKRGFGAVLSSKVRLGGTLAYVGSELLAKSIDVAANI